MTGALPFTVAALQEALAAAGVACELGGGAGARDVVVLRVSRDAGELGPGDLFLAWPGAHRDGAADIGAAIARGASAIVAGSGAAELLAGALSAPAWLRVSDLRAAWAVAQGLAHGEPAAALAMAGITGTNGKTTTSFMTAWILERLGIPTGIVGTIGVWHPGRRQREVPLGSPVLTTPDAADLQAALAELRDAGARAAAVEVSSHGLAQRRLAGLRFTCAALTNLRGNEHLDYHGGIAAYGSAKSLLLTAGVRAGGTAILPANWRDLPGVGGVVLPSDVTVCTFAVAPCSPPPASETALLALEPRPQGFDMCYTARAHAVGGGVQEFAVRVPMPGLFNVENSLVALSVVSALGGELQAAAVALADFPGVPGRFERVDLGQPFTVIVDFAHNPAGLESLLSAARAAAPRRLAVLIGCGGDRDPSKRPLMARLALEMADLAILTTDNPRSEDPGDILAAMLRGVENRDRSRLRVCPDREEAIRTAIAWAAPGDAVILAGKGHEATQIIGNRVLPFSDRDTARKALGAAGWGVANES
ncbi:MAG: UDP-N-acetylmuramoyl-L-alanyl-D-glutamate--2,6-diaminopimelate ligase [Candidatus Schekmanbacteria bacterium]|nr:UDP-N-acetylmuramoyl-L-alanyl-D-glutamate--2,6-diaminopimelate ligase [Candidatus Schekmanbacteria bacterium]